MRVDPRASEVRPSWADSKLEDIFARTPLEEARHRLLLGQPALEQPQLNPERSATDAEIEKLLGTHGGSPPFGASRDSPQHGEAAPLRRSRPSNTFTKYGYDTQTSEFLAMMKREIDQQQQHIRKSLVGGGSPPRSPNADAQRPRGPLLCSATEDERTRTA